MREGWSEVVLGDVFSSTNIRLGGRSEEPPVFSISKYDGVVLASDYFDKRVASKKLDTYKVLQDQNWAYSTIHINEGSIARNHQGFEGVVSPMYTTMQWNNDSHDPRYFEHLLRSSEMLVRYNDNAQGSINRRRSLPWKTFAGMAVRVPPLDEQQRIVDLIGAVDESIEAAEEVANASDLAWWALTSKLEWAAKGSTHVFLGEVSDISGGLTKNKKSQDAEGLLEVPYLRVANVQRRFLDLTEVTTIKVTQQKLNQLRLLPGDVLFNEGGDKDKLGRGDIWRGQVEDCIHQNHVFRARITDKKFAPAFISAWANSFGKQWFETFGTQTTGIASINKATLSRFPIPAFSYEEQQRWADLLETTTAQMDEANAYAEALRNARSELLTALLSGAHEIPDTYDELMAAAV